MNTLTKYYLENRKPTFLPGAYYDGNEAKRLIIHSASTCLRWAREQMENEATLKAWSGETVDSEDDLARLDAETVVALVVSPDDYVDLGDMEGDMFNPRVNPEIRPAWLEQERKNYRAMLEREGVWCISAHYRNASGAWEQGDCCCGFDGGYVEEASCEFMRNAMAMRAQVEGEAEVIEAFASEIS